MNGYNSLNLEFTDNMELILFELLPVYLLSACRLSFYTHVIKCIRAMPLTLMVRYFKYDYTGNHSITNKQTYN